MLTQGTDPEIAFVTEKGSIVPAGIVYRRSGLPVIEPPPPPEGQVQTKGLRIKVTENASLYQDGMSNEFNVAPSNEPSILVSRIGDLLAISHKIAQQQGLKLAIKPTIPVSLEDIESGGVTCAQFGCDRDDTIYKDGFDPARVDAKLEKNRFFGAHFHSSMTETMIRAGGLDWLMSNMYYVMSAFDLTLGLMDVIFDHSDEARQRRRVYGRAGRHRIQVPYGLEYRTPGNAILNDPLVLGSMFALTKYSMILSENFDKIDTLLAKIDQAKLFNTIVGVDYAVAEPFFRTEVYPVLKTLEGHPELQSMRGTLEDLLLLSERPLNTDFMTNWRL